MISFLSNFIALFLYKNNIIDKEKNEVCQYGFEINPKLKTTKSDAHIHGIGLRSVREIIDNLDRIFNITQNEKWFGWRLHINYLALFDFYDK